jgi:hypothetical protein
VAAVERYSLTPSTRTTRSIRALAKSKDRGIARPGKVHRKKRGKTRAW